MGPDPGPGGLVVAAGHGSPLAGGIGGDDPDIADLFPALARKLHLEGEDRVGGPVVIGRDSSLGLEEIKDGPVLCRLQPSGGMGCIDHGHLRDLDKIGIVENACLVCLDVTVGAVVNVRVDLVVGIFARPHQVKLQAPGPVLVGRRRADLGAVVINCDLTVPGGLARDRDLLESRPGGGRDAGGLHIDRNETDGLGDIVSVFLKGQVGVGLFDARGRGQDIETDCPGGLARGNGD